MRIIKKGSVPVVDSVLLYKNLQVSSHHVDWIRRRIDNYGFTDNVDYYRVPLSSLDVEMRGKRRGVYAYLLTLDMAKELSMLENNEIGRNIRKYFIKRDKELRRIESIRIAGIEVRKTLTDIIEESGENERMHGRGFGNYTRLVYSLTGLSEKKKAYGTKDGFRDTLTAEELDRVKNVEAIIKPLLEMDKEYGEIKEALKPLFEKEE